MITNAGYEIGEILENQAPYGQIYAIVDPFCEQLDGKVQYIGKHKLGKRDKNNLQLSLEKYLKCKIRCSKKYNRMRPHDVYLRSEIKDSIGNFYEKPKIEQVEVCYSEIEMGIREEYWRLFFLGFYPNLLNVFTCNGGWSLTKKTKQKISRSKFGKKRSEEERKSISASMKILFANPKNHPSYKPENHIIETRICNCGCGEVFECVSVSKKRFIYGHHTRGKYNPMSGKNIKDHMTPEAYFIHNDNIRKSRLGKSKLSKEQIQEIIEKKNNGVSIKELAQKYNVSRTTIRNKIKA